MLSANFKSSLASSSLIMSNTILTSIPKLNGKNYSLWKEAFEAFLMMEDLSGVLSGPPNSKAKSLKDDAKVYGFLFYSVEPNCRTPLSELAVKSGHSGWISLKNIYEKDSPSIRMSLRRQFFSVTHDPSRDVSTFIDSVLSIVRQLEAIGRKPDEDEVLDKILVSLDPSFASISTMISLQNPAYSIDAARHTLTEFEANLKSRVTQPKPDIAMYGGASKSRFGGEGGVQPGGGRFSDEIDWTNTRRREGVCFRCGRSGHTAQYCVADMPEEVKRRILKPRDSAHAASEDSTFSDLSSHFSQLKTDDIASIANDHSVIVPDKAHVTLLSTSSPHSRGHSSHHNHSKSSTSGSRRSQAQRLRSRPQPSNHSLICNPNPAWLTKEVWNSWETEEY